MSEILKKLSDTLIFVSENMYGNDDDNLIFKINHGLELIGRINHQLPKISDIMYELREDAYTRKIEKELLIEQLQEDIAILTEKRGNISNKTLHYGKTI